MALLALAGRPLFNPDEGRYAEIPREMLASGDWVIPHLDGLAYIEKPPLQYWITAVCFSLLGVGAFSARLFTLCAGLGTLAVAGWLARTLGPPLNAMRTMLILAGMALFIIMGQILTLDMGLSFFLTAALAGFMVAQVLAERGELARSRRAMLMAWVAMALGMLTKGLIAVLIPAASLVLYCLYTRDFAPCRRLQLGFGLALFIAIVLPWHWLAQIRLDDFVQFYFVREHFQRFSTPIENRQEPWWFFAQGLIWGTLPWTVSALRVLGTGWRRTGFGSATGVRFDTNLFMWIWTAFILIFFSLSDSKLVPYILPAFPTLALMMAALPERVFRFDLRIAAALLVLLGLTAAFGAAALPWLTAHSARAVYLLKLRPGLAFAALVMLAAGAAGLGLRRSQSGRALLAVTLGGCFAVLSLLYTARVLAPVYSGVTLAAAIERRAPGAPIYSVNTYDQSLSFYLRRNLSLVHYRGELDYGLRHDPRRAIAGADEFLVRWREQPDALAVMDIGTFAALEARAVPMKELARDAHRIVVGHP